MLMRFNSRERNLEKSSETTIEQSFSQAVGVTIRI